MKKLFFLFFVTSAMLIAGCTYPVENTVICVQLDPLEKVFTEESYFVENADTAAVAKGETATFQFVIKSVFPIQELKIEAGNLVNGNRKIVPTLKAFVKYVRAGKHTYLHSKDAIFPVSDLYPDCLEDIESVDVQSMQNQPVWISYAIPRDAESGDYTATLVFTGKVNGKQINITKQVNAKIYPVTLPEQTLWITNWWSPFQFSKMNGNQPVEPYSDRYWELLTNMAHMMRDHGQNAYKIGGFHQDDFWPSLCIKSIGNQYTFDFTNFDKMVELLIREGNLKRIEGGHLAGRMSHWDSDFGVNVPEIGAIPLTDVRAQSFLTQFLQALCSHLEAKGWKEMYVQYVADEPLDGNAESFVRIIEFVKKHLPGIPIMDAVMTHKLPKDIVDIWVIKLDHLRDGSAFFRERQAEGKEVWLYTCNKPQGNYANRLIEQPLVQTRLLHWINYRYQLPGYLHWGLNYWKEDPFDFSTSNLAGDPWIIYPGDGKVYTSIRLEAMRDGIADYELLKLLAQKAPDKAEELAGFLIKDVDNYISNVRVFRLTRLKLLEELSK